MFDDEFLTSLPENTFKALKSIRNEFEALDGEFGGMGEYDEYIKAYAFLQVFLETHDLNLEFVDLDNIQREDHIGYIIKTFFEDMDSTGDVAAPMVLGNASIRGWTCDKT